MAHDHPHIGGRPHRAPPRSVEPPLLTHGNVRGSLDERTGRPSGTRRRLRAGLWALLGLVVLGPPVAFALGWLLIPGPSPDDTSQLQTSTFTFSDGSPLAVVRPDDVNRIKITLDEVPIPVQNAVLAAEDRTFRSNPGFDIMGIGRAVISQLTGGDGGGSTITQEDYLNTIHFGRGAYGIEAASKAYFGKDVGDLTVSEGAMIAGIIQSPTGGDPSTALVQAKARWSYVLDGMVRTGWLSPTERARQVFPDDWLRTAPAARGIPDDDRLHIYARAKVELGAAGITQDQIDTEGLTITTTVDPATQKQAVAAVAATMDDQPTDLRTALVAVDSRTGAIVAYDGGPQGLGTDYAQCCASRGRRSNRSSCPPRCRPATGSASARSTTGRRRRRSPARSSPTPQAQLRPVHRPDGHDPFDQHGLLPHRGRHGRGQGRRRRTRGWHPS